MEYLKLQRNALQLVKEVGFNNIEMHFHHRPEWVARVLQKMVEEFELRPYSIHLPKFLLSKSEKEFESDVDSIFKLIQSLEIEISVLHPPFPGHLEETAWMDRVEILLEKSKQTSSLLTLELVPYLERPHRFIKKQMERYSGFQMGTTIDLEYLYLHHLDLQEMVELFGNRLLNIHFRDSDGYLVDSSGKRKYIVPGDGKIDLESMLTILHETKYEKAITIEVSHKDPDNIFRAMKYTKALLDKIKKKNE